MTTGRLILAIIGAAIAITLASALFVVKETDRVLVLTLGKVEREISEPGLYVRKPFVQQTVQLDDRILMLDGEAEEVVTRDKKRILVDTFTRWRIADAISFYESVRTLENGRAQLRSIVNSATKRSLARNDMMTIVSGERRLVMSDILTEVREQAKTLGINVVDVRIKRADLPKENSLAVFNRMRAERNKEATDIRARGEEEAQKIRANAERERTVLLANAERDAMRLRGEGDAQAIRIFATAFEKAPDFYEFTRTLEAYRNSLSRQDTTILLDPKVKFLDAFMGREGRN